MNRKSAGNGSFSRTAKAVKKINVMPKNMRGGTRL